MDSEQQPASPRAAPGASGGRRLPGRTPSGLLGQAAQGPQQPQPQLGKGALQLNQSSSAATTALPVKRRGSFQQLKKIGAAGGRDGSSSHLDSDSAPSIFAIVKKSTHWEKYGTVLVLLVADELSSDKEAVVQMLSAEGYDDQTSDSIEEAVKLFSEREVYPDIVIVDSDNELVDTKQLIKALQALNPTVAVLVLGSRGGPMGAVAALQAGAADYMVKPLDLDEVVARVERHVQRQHCIKLEMEKALEHAKEMMQQLMPASLLGDVMLRKDGSAAGGAPAGGKASLNSVAETDFEEQMSELSEENHRLGQKVQEMERKLELKDQENRDLEAKLNAIDRKVSALAASREMGGGNGGGNGGGGGSGCTAVGPEQRAAAQQAAQAAQASLQGQLNSVAQANEDLRHKVDELERLMQSHTGVTSASNQNLRLSVNGGQQQG
ncbi:hypothetical protein CHLRE_10g446450v5 [Chlamydomonas reinhardtii]|uniref:Response regulatory domain-containing protein n=1 Tax=Chlamydomonas reinhardtii TaxID=3055 RepID=A0A2K3DAV8_CHLRE|nr:uncharacterized protein CHLRE_10g446450v5 [Chlamydomonas reinhardtii]PNW77668.1 hypothetical protein CHLRE_10g446450v5 [Chlamydomonas reinhardtii]